MFDEVEAAERAINEIQGFELFDKPMRLDYAKTKSDAIVQREGNPDEFETHKRRRLAEKGMPTSPPYLGLEVTTDPLSYRKKASCRSRRSTKETQTTCRRSSTRAGRVTPGQSCPWRWSEIIKSSSWSRHTRRVSSTEQDPIRTESTGRLRCRGTYGYIWQV